MNTATITATGETTDRILETVQQILKHPVGALEYLASESISAQDPTLALYIQTLTDTIKRNRVDRGDSVQENLVLYFAIYVASQFGVKVPRRYTKKV